MMITEHCISHGRRKAMCKRINVDINRISLNEPVSLLWTDDATYADYLTATFEVLWENSIPAAEQIQKLLARGPLRA